MWYVYLLQLANDDIYIGSTNDLKRRVTSHRVGQVESTRSNLPTKLRAYVAVETETIARRLERYFKSGSGKAVTKKRLL
jgi:putative endonuclease